MSTLDEKKAELAQMQATVKAEERYETAKAAFLAAPKSAAKKAAYRDAMAELDAARTGGAAK